MVNALIQIDAETNRILNTVKAARGLKGKGEAVEYIAKRYAETTFIAFDHDGRQFKPEFIKSVLAAQERLRERKGKSFDSIKSLDKELSQPSVRSSTRRKTPSRTTQTKAKESR